MRRGSQRPGRPAASRNPSLTPRRLDGAGPPAWSGRKRSRAAITARKDNAFSPKHTVVSTVTVSRAARAGPATRALLTTTPLRLTVRARSFGRHQAADEGLAGGRVGDRDDAPAPPMATNAPRRPPRPGTPAPTTARPPGGCTAVHTLGHRPAKRSQQERRDPPVARTSPRSLSEPVSSRTSPGRSPSAARRCRSRTSTWPPK